MHAPRRRRLTRACAAALLALVAGTARGADDPTPTPPLRVSYWVDRLVSGPEATTWEIPDFHQNLLLDAERNLVALGPATLDRLADPALVRRVQASPDANPWHAILNVLRLLAAARPDVARAWAVPALRHDLSTLRRAALPVIAALRDPADGPVLAEVLAHDLDDRALGPLAVETLLALGPPWDAIAVRALYERASTDQPFGASSLWTSWPSVAEAVGHPARADALAWWALLAETSGPLVRSADAAREAGGRGTTPRRLEAVPLSHAVPQGRAAAALARARLAAAGHAPAKASVAEDLASGDEVLARAALEADPPAVRARARAQGERWVSAWRSGPSPRIAPADVVAAVRTLADDPSPEATDVLRGLLESMPAGSEWGAALAAAYGALARRGAEDAAYLERLLRAGTPGGTDLALYVARSAKSLGALDVLERWHDAPESGPARLRLRREIAFLYGHWVARDGLAPERVEAFVRRLAAWVDDPADPSGPALAGVLPDLGPAGDRALAAGLRGPRRAAWLGAVRRRPGRYAAADVVAALLEPVGRDTPPAQRRRALEAALAVAGSDALAALDALASRVPPDARADVDVVRGIVRWRVPSAAE